MLKGEHLFVRSKSPGLLFYCVLSTGDIGPLPILLALARSWGFPHG